MDTAPSNDPASRAKRLGIGHVSIDPLSFAQAIDAIEGLVAARRGGSVFTPNVDHVVLAEHDARLRAAYDNVSLSLVDGVPVLWTSRLLGKPLPEKVSGSDLVLPLMERAEARGWRVYLLGGLEGVAIKASAKLRERYPRLAIVGTDSPMIDVNADASNYADVVLRIQQARPDILLVALGCPKQEIWISDIASRISPAVAIGVGAGIDFVAGTIPRAPAWMSKVGVEWLYRFAREPRRLWRRYFVRDPEFLLIVLRELRKRR